MPPVRGTLPGRDAKADGQAVATREEAKNQRRGQILRAARELMRGGDVGFTMRRLAESANVSIATPYNLFGSKQAVMFALLEADLAEFSAAVEADPAEAPELLFRVVDIATERYGRDPDYHRAVLFAAYSDGGREYRSLFEGPGHRLWRDMIARGIERGELAPVLQPDAFAAMLELQLFSCVLEWVRGELSLAELGLRAHYGFALILLGVVDEPRRADLERRVASLQTRLTTLWTERVQAAATDPDSGSADRHSA